MSSLTLNKMGKYLSQSISSFNDNKLFGLLAELDLRTELTRLGFEDRISPGGWIARSEGSGNFAHHTKVFFPSSIKPGKKYTGTFSDPPRALHTICATMHQIGIQSYYCIPKIGLKNDPNSIEWYCTQLGIPTSDSFHKIGDVAVNFNRRVRNYNFLKYTSKISSIPKQFLPEEFSKENLRVSFQNEFMSEISDIDGVFWGQQYTYPVEIKEKTAAKDPRIGEYFGLDIGPFVKLAFFAAKKGNLHSIFFVKEIDNIVSRKLVAWWFITYEQLSQYASWVPQSGGKSMRGSASAVVKIPKSEFIELNATNLNAL